MESDPFSAPSTACAISAEGRPYCWIWNYQQNAFVTRDDDWKPGRVVEIAYPCARYDDNSVGCLPYQAPIGLPLTHVAALRSRRWGSLCTVSESGSATCSFVSGTMPEGDLVDLAFGLYHVCGLSRDGSVACTSRYPRYDELIATLPSETGFSNWIR